MVAPEPETDRARGLREQMSAARWESVVGEALERVRVIETVRVRRQETGESWRKCLSAVAPETGWSKYSHWRRRYEEVGGAAWERLLDRRVPPPRVVGEKVAMAARALRRANRGISCEAAREVLRQEFGGELTASDTWLRRQWAAAGLRYVRSAAMGLMREVGEEVEELHGGGGLALLAAADAETGSSLTLAQAVLSAGSERAAGQSAVTPRDEGEGVRDDRGRFMPSYNAEWRKGHAPGERDPRWAADAAKAQQRVLAELPLLAHRPATLAHKLLCMGAAALVTERRGFDGLDGPTGHWLGALGGNAYMPATLDKALAQLGPLKVDAALWAAHAGPTSKSSSATDATASASTAATATAVVKSRTWPSSPSSSGLAEASPTRRLHKPGRPRRAPSSQLPRERWKPPPGTRRSRWSTRRSRAPRQRSPSNA